MVQSIRIFNERKSRKVDNKGKRDLMSELVEIRVKFGGLSKSSKINLSIIKQPKISILFISYLRIGRIDFDATSNDLVMLSLLCRMVQSISKNFS
jgi:hypothetical protein